MAAAFRSINARIRANKYLDYLFSTHFWGPASNFGIPLAAIADAQKDPEIISGTMTGALTVYSATFMRYSLAVTPRNWLLFACHFINFNSQLFQGSRYLRYWHYGGKEGKVAAEAKSGAQGVLAEGKQLATETKAEAKSIAEQAKQKAAEAKDKVVR